eukprot:GHVU01031991.1.p3 GENE.GHVU01031991.1~~GHVU01031991.1.p3  ORF type:complete len:110 (-),score=7.69 GHVU01031991.1:1321-1650(-)
MNLAQNFWARSTSHWLAANDGARMQCTQTEKRENRLQREPGSTGGREDKLSLLLKKKRKVRPLLSVADVDAPEEGGITPVVRGEPYRDTNSRYRDYIIPGSGGIELQKR